MQKQKHKEGAKPSVETYKQTFFTLAAQKFVVTMS